MSSLRVERKLHERKTDKTRCLSNTASSLILDFQQTLSAVTAAATIRATRNSDNQPTQRAATPTPQNHQARPSTWPFFFPGCKLTHALPASFQPLNPHPRPRLTQPRNESAPQQVSMVLNTPRLLPTLSTTQIAGMSTFRLTHFHERCEGSPILTLTCQWWDTACNAAMSVTERHT